MHGRTASPAHDPSKVKVKRSKRPIPTRSAFIPGRHRCTGRLSYTRMVIAARSFESTGFVGSLWCGWNRIADALDDYFGVPNINTAAMRTAITFVDPRCASATGSTNEEARPRRASSFVWRSGRDSPTSCRPRMRVHAHPFEPRRKPRRRLPPLPSRAPASGRNPTAQMKKPAQGGRTRRASSFSGGADGTRLHLAGRGCACTRIPSSPAGSRAGGFLRSAVTRPQAGATRQHK